MLYLLRKPSMASINSYSTFPKTDTRSGFNIFSPFSLLLLPKFLCLFSVSNRTMYLFLAYQIFIPSSSNTLKIISTSIVLYFFAISKKKKKRGSNINYESYTPIRKKKKNNVIVNLKVIQIFVVLNYLPHTIILFTFHYILL